MSHPNVSELKRSKYRILGLIGQGQFGRVYCALHRKTGRLVALKSLDCDRFPTHKFLRELRFLLSLQHPNILTCEAIEHIQGGRYLVMEYCEGGTLRTLMENHDRLHPALSIQLVMNVLAGVEHAHQRGIVHCDIKPENILLNIHATGWTARITDFGIARLSQEFTSEGVNITGSPAYMAPERFYGQYSHSTDLYAIGILLFELLVGHRPFSGRPTELMAAHMNQCVIVPEHIPAALRSIVLTALQKLRARRFQSATEMLSALKIAVQEIPELQLTHVLAKPALGEGDQVPFLLREEILRHSVEHLAATDSRALPEYDRYLRRSSFVFLAESLKTPSAAKSFGSQIRSRMYSSGLLSTSRQRGEESAVMAIPEPINTLVVRNHVCFGLAPRSLYELSEQEPKLLTRFHQPAYITIEPQGQWMAVGTLTPEQTLGIFSIWKLPKPRLTHVPTVVSCDRGQFFQLLAIDHRYVIALSRIAPKTHVRLFSRRGQCLGEMVLPIEFEQAIALNQPYQFAALEADHPKSLLLIQLKPLKILRIKLAIAPKFIAAFPWGLVAVDTFGQMVILDRQGQPLGQAEIPGPVSAITSFGNAGLVIATWQQSQGKLYTFDLHQFGIESM